MMNLAIWWWPNSQWWTWPTLRGWNIIMYGPLTAGQVHHREFGHHHVKAAGNINISCMRYVLMHPLAGLRDQQFCTEQPLSENCKNCRNSSSIDTVWWYISWKILFSLFKYYILKLIIFFEDEHNHRHNYLNFSFCHYENSIFYLHQIFLTKTGFSLIYYDVIFPIQWSEFTNSLNFGSNQRNTVKKPNFIYFFSLKNLFL